MIEACAVPACSHGGDGHGELDATPGLERCDDRRYTPGLDLVVACALETPQAFRVFVDSPDLFLKDNGRSGCGTDHRSEPPEVGRAPGGRACIADIVPEHAGCEPELGGLEVPQGLFAGTGEIAHGFICNLRDRDGGEIACAPQPGSLDGVTTVGVPTIAGLVGHA